MPKKLTWSPLTKHWQLKVAKAIVTKQTELATLWREYLKTLKEI